MLNNNIKIGDRWELSVGKEFLSPELLSENALFNYLLSLGVDEFTISGEDGNTLSLEYDKSFGTFFSPKLKQLIPKKQNGLLFLECISIEPFEFRIVCQPLRQDTNDNDFSWADRGEHITIDENSLSLLKLPVRSEGVGMDSFLLGLEAGRLSTMLGFERLLCLPILRDIELLEHQTHTALTVLRRFRGRALLCDEVGLGKTIEAGMILLELVARGLVRRVLILTPPSLVAQFKSEMSRKFGLDFVCHDEPEFKENIPESWQDEDHIIASYHTAKLEPHRSSILSKEWDMVIIDEAHHFRNRNTLLWRFASQIRKKYILLLTATPVQNNLEELFNLVTLLEPGLLSTSRSFQKRFIDGSDKMMPKNIDKLHELLKEVMVRNRRSNITVKFTKRHAKTLRVNLSPEERDLYNEVSSFVKKHISEGALSRMALIILQKEMGSSSKAAAPTITKIAQNRKITKDEKNRLLEMAQTAKTIEENVKAEQLLDILSDFPDKVVVFTQFLVTQELIYNFLVEAGVEVELFNGGMSRLKKEEAIKRFRQDARVLVSTESGSEGQNLQFCNAICNFDLPWNPQKIEQRVGRLSRIGQTRDVHIFNLVASNTLEDAILYLLSAKINMFELVVGEIDMILGNFDSKREFDDLVTDLWTSSKDSNDFQTKIEELGERLLEAKRAYIQQREYDDKLFGDKFISEG